MIRKITALVTAPAATTAARQPSAITGQCRISPATRVTRHQTATTAANTAESTSQMTR